VLIIYKTNPTSCVLHTYTVMGIYIRGLGKLPQIKSLVRQAFNKIVPKWNYPVGTRAIDQVDCDCNGVLVKYKGNSLIYDMARESQSTWHVLNDKEQPDPSLPFLGLGASLHWGCHNVS